MGWRRHTTPSMGRDQRIALVLEFLSHEKVEMGFVRQPRVNAVERSVSVAYRAKGQRGWLTPREHLAAGLIDRVKRFA